MSIPRKRIKPSLDCRQHLDEQLRSVMIRWLEHKLSQLMKAHDRLKAAGKLSRSEYLTNNIAYYRNAISCTKWLIAQIRSQKVIDVDSLEGGTDESSTNATARKQ